MFVNHYTVEEVKDSADVHGGDSTQQGQHGAGVWGPVMVLRVAQGHRSQVPIFLSTIREDGLLIQPQKKKGQIGNDVVKLQAPRFLPSTVVMKSIVPSPKTNWRGTLLLKLCENGYQLPQPNTDTKSRLLAHVLEFVDPTRRCRKLVVLTAARDTKRMLFRLNIKSGKKHRIQNEAIERNPEWVLMIGTALTYRKTGCEPYMTMKWTENTAVKIWHRS
ncbi:hypothetical protein HPB51_017304 [Rhipicephalus microplus]|uniref:Uncharacterized protein n=1 Tax=Rhipicephalus microplus TaxID=6941 RepID=A0A9J6EUB2_RHIMP|nr:hypothetical protein HPB51_017304 [Rhipicephalus microplus]